MLVVKNLPANAGGIRDADSVPGSGRFLGGEHSNPLQCSFLENPLDRGTKSQARLKHKESDTTEVTRAHTRNKGLSMKIKGLIQEEDITTVNVCAPSIGAP